MKPVSSSSNRRPPMPGGLKVVLAGAVLFGAVLAVASALAAMVYFSLWHSVVPLVFSGFFIVAAVGIGQRRDGFRKMAIAISLLATPLYATTLGSLGFGCAFGCLELVTTPFGIGALTLGVFNAYYLNRPSVRAYCAR